MDISQAQFEAIKAAATDSSIVSGATHRFYRYPARFSPVFARAVIDHFTSPGDLVIDPFVGGGTTAVEAFRSGRMCIANDINELAVFVSKVKCNILTANELKFLSKWLPKFEKGLKINRKTLFEEKWLDSGYFRNVEDSETWRHRNIIQIALDMIDKLPSKRLIDFSRCVVLRSAQLSLDGRKSVMSIEELRYKISEHFFTMMHDMENLRSEISLISKTYKPRIMKSDSTTLHTKKVFNSNKKPKLILTSPPYPGVRVVYHRWQVKGRRETPAPYWIANKLDGAAGHYYTLGSRCGTNLEQYFSNLFTVFNSLSKVSDSKTKIVQMVAFSQPEWQFPLYLKTLEEAGLKELKLSGIANSSKSNILENRIWRDVPNRKWHAERQSQKSGSREVVLIHSKA